MARKARIDIPGGLYHVIARGNERGRIFRQESDYSEFLSRLTRYLAETGQKCLAWACIPNHFHLLILRGKRPLSDLMRRQMTAYAGYFNRKYRRAGHLFQDRYKAILCQEEEYLLEATAYIHLNPMRAGLVKRYEDLESYKWCGHCEVIKGAKAHIIDREYLLSHFGERTGAAISRYKVFLEERVGKYKTGEYSGGGLLKSAGGLGAVRGRKAGEKEVYDDRILGDGDFVETALKETENIGKADTGREEILKEAEQISGEKPGLIFNGGRARAAVKIRAVYCFLSCEKRGLKGTDLMRELGLSSGAISYLCRMGRGLVEGNN